jgi:UDP-N-acetylmuramate--alanine ligase
MAPGQTVLPDAAVSLVSGPRHVHVIGIGGAGMSAIATVLAAMGHRVTGSDLRGSAVTERLGTRGIAVALGHAAVNLAGVDVVTASPAVGPDNVELVEARRLGLGVLARSEVLAAIASIRKCVAVAGTHGKTTTSSMLALALSAGGLRPSFLIGADVGDLEANGVLDAGSWLVLEADESYGTFAHLTPEMTVLTSVEADHLDHYGTVDALHDAFGRLLEATTGPRFVVADDPGAAALGRGVGARSVGESEDADYRVGDLELSRSSIRFALGSPDGPLGIVAVPIPGRHNARNAALAAVAAIEIGAGFDAVAAALARFAGSPRRYEFRGEAGGVTFVDDYGHLPGEIAPTLATARLGGFGRVVAVFQPHRYTRTAALAPEFAHAFDDADVVVVTDVYSAGEPPIPGVTGRLVADAVSAARPGAPVYYAPSRPELRGLVASLLVPGDVCVTLGAGDLTTLADDLEADLVR